MEHEENEEWAINPNDKDFFQEFDVTYQLDGQPKTVTVKAEPPVENSSPLQYLVIDSSGISFYLYHQQKSMSWLDVDKGETPEAKVIGEQIENYFAVDESPREDFGVDEPEGFDNAKPFRAWIKIFGRSFHYRIEPDFENGDYKIYDLDSERESDHPAFIIYEHPDDTEWYDRQQGHTVYSLMIGKLIESVYS